MFRACTCVVWKSWVAPAARSGVSVLLGKYTPLPRKSDVQFASRRQAGRNHLSHIPAFVQTPSFLSSAFIYCFLSCVSFSRAPSLTSLFSSVPHQTPLNRDYCWHPSHIWHLSLSFSSLSTSSFIRYSRHIFLFTRFHPHIPLKGSSPPSIPLLCLIFCFHPSTCMEHVLPSWNIFISVVGGKI